jgi:hypothetical protein
MEAMGAPSPWSVSRLRRSAPINAPGLPEIYARAGAARQDQIGAGSDHGWDEDRHGNPYPRHRLGQSIRPRHMCQRGRIFDPYDRCSRFCRRRNSDDRLRSQRLLVLTWRALNRGIVCGVAATGMWSHAPHAGAMSCPFRALLLSGCRAARRAPAG